MLADRDIIQRCQGGETESFEVLVERHGTAVYSLCRKLGRTADVADDLFQETWIRAMQRIEQFALDRSFTTWLFAICVNCYRDQHRRRRRWLRRIMEFGSSESMEREMERWPADGPAPDARVIDRETEEMVRTALGQLDDLYRLPILLYYFREHDVAEVAEILGIPAGTVKSRLSTGRKQLAEILRETHHAGV